MTVFPECAPLLIKRLRPDACLPTKGSPGAAGFDLYATDGGVIPADGKGLVGTGLAVTVPAGTYGRIAPRSGLAVKHSIDVGAGVIDQDYTGECRILLFNHGSQDFAYKAGDRVAQLIVEYISTPPIVEVVELAASTRDVSGFGSTGP